MLVKILMILVVTPHVISDQDLCAGACLCSVTMSHHYDCLFSCSKLHFAGSLYLVTHQKLLPEYRNYLLSKLAGSAWGTNAATLQTSALEHCVCCCILRVEWDVKTLLTVAEYYWPGCLWSALFSAGPLLHNRFFWHYGIIREPIMMMMMMISWSVCSELVL